MSEANKIAADLFCGSGSVTAALKQSGFSVKFAVDFDRWAAKTYRLNHPEVTLFEADIRQLQAAEIKRKTRLQKVDLLAVCAPCQPFSLQNRHRGDGDLRSSLVLETIRFAKSFDVETIWIENVPGLANSAEAAHLKRDLTELGFRFSEPLRIDAAELGVPQRRVRSVFVASKDDLPLERLEALRSYRIAEKKTVREAFTGLRAARMKGMHSDDPLHVARNHNPLTVRRLAAIPLDGGSRISLPDELQLACHKKLGSGSFPDVYGRMSWEKPSPTLTTGCTDVTRGRFAHPTENRAITLREAARLQSFPDEYKFCGSYQEISRIIGNAVPMEMARKIFQWLFSGTWPEKGPSQIFD